MTTFPLTAGNDTCTGTAGDDIFQGPSGGTDSLNGGDGGDRFYIGDSSSAVSAGTIEGGNGIDLLFAAGDITNCTITGVEALLLGLGEVWLTSEQINSFGQVVDANQNWMTIHLTTPGSVGANFADTWGKITIYGSAGADVIDMSHALQYCFIYAGDDLGGNELHGGGHTNWLYSGEGGDTLYGEGGNDYLYGNGGNDTLYGGSGFDVLEGGAGDDLLVSGGNGLFEAVSFRSATNGVTVDLVTGIATGQGTDTLVDGFGIVFGSDFDDSITGSTADEWMIGGQGYDTLVGGGGVDQLEGGDGNDSLSGGEGDDRLIGGAGDDTLDGGNGIDSASYTYAGAAISVNGESVSGGAGNDTLHGIERLFGSQYNDYIRTGSSVLEYVDGGAGDDTLVGSDGCKALYGGEGKDLLCGGFRGDLYGGNGDDTFNVWSSYLDGTWIIDGGDGNDTLMARSSCVAFEIRNVETLLIGDPHYSVADVALTSAQLNSFSTVNVAPGVTSVSIRVASAGEIGSNFASVSPRVTVHISSSFGVNIIDMSQQIADVDLYEPDETGGNTLIGGHGDDIIRSGVGGDTLIGNDGRDYLSGGGGDDTISGGSGADFLVGGAGDDNIDGGADLDLLSYKWISGSVVVNLEMGRAIGDGTDSLTGIEDVTGSNFDDRIIGSAGNNTLDGGQGNDTIRGGDGYDRLVGSFGNDILNGGLGADTQIGGAGDDLYVRDDSGDLCAELSFDGTDQVLATVSTRLTANVEILRLGGADAINGSGNDLDNVVTGNDAGNILSGGLGNDTLIGGQGNDRFVFATALDAAGNVDRIADFSSAENDRIRLDDAIFTALADPSQPAHLLSAAQFVAGNGAVATTADQHVIYDTRTGALYYDADGAGGADQVQFAVLTGRPVIDHGDFAVF